MKEEGEGATNQGTKLPILTFFKLPKLSGQDGTLFQCLVTHIPRPMTSIYGHSSMDMGNRDIKKPKIRNVGKATYIKLTQWIIFDT